MDEHGNTQTTQAMCQHLDATRAEVVRLTRELEDAERELEATEAALAKRLNLRPEVPRPPTEHLRPQRAPRRGSTVAGVKVEHTRRLIYRALQSNGAAKADELSAVLGLNIDTVRGHLNFLADQCVVVKLSDFNWVIAQSYLLKEQEGNGIYYLKEEIDGQANNVG